MLQHFGIARHLHVDHQAECGDIDAPRGHVGRHADPRAAIAQRLQRMVALVLAVLARKRHCGEAAFDQRGVKMPHVVARGAEQHRRFRFVEAQQVDDSVFDVGRRNGHHLVGDVAMALPFVDRRDAQGIALIALGQRLDRLGHRRRKQEGAAAFGRGVEQFLKIVAEAHVEHLVRFVEHREGGGREVERAALQMIAQTAGRTDDDVRALEQRAPFAHRVHPADAGDNAQPRLAEQPGEFLADLQRQFACGGDHQRARRLRAIGNPAGGEQVFRHGDAERHRLAGTGLRGHEQVAPLRLRLQHGGLHRGGAPDSHARQARRQRIQEGSKTA